MRRLCISASRPKRIAGRGGKELKACHYARQTRHKHRSPHLYLVRAWTWSESAQSLCRCSCLSIQISQDILQSRILSSVNVRQLALQGDLALELFSLVLGRPGSRRAHLERCKSCAKVFLQLLCCIAVGQQQPLHEGCLALDSNIISDSFK